MALAAIQGLHEKLADKELEIAELRARVDELESLEGKLAELEAAMATVVDSE